MINIAQISSSTGSTPTNALAWRDSINEAMALFDISTPKRQAAFLAQIGHESGCLTSFTENLNYTPEGLLATFGKRFTKDDAARYGRTASHLADQSSIACIAYANRMGNGPRESGDGWRYRGRGPIQSTGLDNYTMARDALRKLLGADVPDFVTDPGQVATPQWGAMCAALYWQTHQCNALADLGEFDSITKAINPAMAGKDARSALWGKAKAALGVST